MQQRKRLVMAMFMNRVTISTEFDLVLEKAGTRVAIEIKASACPKLGRGNWSAL